MSLIPPSEMQSQPTLFQSVLSRLASELKTDPALSTPTDYEEWLRKFYPKHFNVFAPHHREMWQWVDSLELGIKPAQAFIGIFARGGGKSTAAETSVAYVGAHRTRHYAIYVRGTQEQADNSVDNIASLLESPYFGEFYPELSNKQVGKFGQTRGWRRNRLRTASGFTVDAFGLDTALRGIKIEERRPDYLIFDDIDSKHDTISTTLKKIERITTSVLPAGSSDCAILGIQNLITSHGFFARLADNSADYLYNRKVVGPIPAIRNLEVEQVWDEGRNQARYKIVHGEPTWAHQGIEVCEGQINDWGLISFLVEAQHDVDVVEGGTYAGVNYEHIRLDQCPQFKRVVCWVDPAVSDSDDADCMGIQIDALGADKKIYRLYSWEDRTSPEMVIRRAIQKAMEYEAREIGFETDQGGVLWRNEYYRVYELMLAEGAIPETWNRPAFKSAKAGSIGSKRHRHNMQRSAYDRGMFVHVLGTHQTLENALKRFPMHKPFDLADSSFWAFRSLTQFGGGWSKNYMGGDA